MKHAVGIAFFNFLLGVSLMVSTTSPEGKEKEEKEKDEGAHAIAFVFASVNALFMIFASMFLVPAP